MQHLSIKLALLSIFTMGTILVIGQQPQSEKPPASEQPQAQQPAEAPPHEFNIDDNILEQAIKSELGKDPQVYSNVAVQVTDTEVVLAGTVRTSSEKDRVAKIAAANAGARKIVNQLKVKPE